MSAASASEQPAPAQGPRTAATTGSGSANRASISGLKCASSAAPTSSGRPPPEARSAPLEKPRPSPLSSRQRAPEPGRLSTAARSSSTIAPLSAFNESGRFRVTVATAAGLRSRRICSKSMRVGNAPPTESLARRGHPPDRIADVVGDEEGAVAGDLAADRPAVGVAPPVDEAGQDVDRPARRAAIGEGDEDDPVAAERPSIPRTVLADEGAAGVRRAEPGALAEG